MPSRRRLQNKLYSDRHIWRLFKQNTAVSIERIIERLRGQKSNDETSSPLQNNDSASITVSNVDFDDYTYDDNGSSSRESSTLNVTSEENELRRR